MKETVKLFNIIFEFLNECSEEEISELLEKKATIIIQKKELSSKSHLSLSIDDAFFEKLENAQSREDAYQLFQLFSFKKSQLKEIGAHYSISFGNKENNVVMVEKIVEAVVGSKLKHRALLNVNLNTTR